VATRSTPSLLNVSVKCLPVSVFMFRVLTRGYSEEFERWTDALETANSLKPKCRNWLQDIRIYDGEELVWVYSRSHTYPQYIGAGTYNRLARMFIQEAIAESAPPESETPTMPEETPPDNPDNGLDPNAELSG